ncbi:hypothetical protein An01g05870 [Aspergillus niger]|uniref:Uncharacterized protein n=2 Tax=Aspergillus niger TaxID=5061 RepID=A2Q8X2_ASPNC|nr:hypothetical protein An01g05870 [Aspergillus niger]CAK37062.1 hypothetical protein An01g05870 [Aspergillus niger]
MSIEERGRSREGRKLDKRQEQSTRNGRVTNDPEATSPKNLIMNMLLAVYCRDVYGIFSIGRCRVLSGVCYALEFAKNPVCMLEPVMQISCQSGQTIPVIGVDVPACAYPLGFFSGCSGYGMDTSPKTRLQLASLPLLWNLHINSVGSEQIPSQPDQSHFPLLSTDSCGMLHSLPQKMTERYFSLLLNLWNIACQLNKSQVTNSQSLCSPQARFLTCRSVACLTDCHCCGPKRGGPSCLDIH